MHETRKNLVWKLDLFPFLSFVLPLITKQYISRSPKGARLKRSKCTQNLSSEQTKHKMTNVQTLERNSGRLQQNMLEHQSDSLAWLLATFQIFLFLNAYFLFVDINYIIKTFISVNNKFCITNINYQHKHWKQQNWVKCTTKYLIFLALPFFKECASSCAIHFEQTYLKSWLNFPEEVFSLLIFFFTSSSIITFRVLHFICGKTVIWPFFFFF